MGIRESLLFLGQARDRFHHTGALLPSSRALARALAACIPPEVEAPRVLELGPGTGSLTRVLQSALPTGSRLDIVEINPRFADYLESEVLQPSSSATCRVLRGDFLELELDPGYDAVLSGLPLNNFSAEVAEAILRKALGLTRNSGVTAWFEYLGIRTLKSLWASEEERRRLAGIQRTMDVLFDQHLHRRNPVLWNMPPAVVHKLTRSRS